MFSGDGPIRLTLTVSPGDARWRPVHRKEQHYGSERLSEIVNNASQIPDAIICKICARDGLLTGTSCTRDGVERMAWPSTAHGQYREIGLSCIHSCGVGLLGELAEICGPQPLQQTETLIPTMPHQSQEPAIQITTIRQKPCVASYLLLTLTMLSSWLPDGSLEQCSTNRLVSRK